MSDEFAARARVAAMRTAADVRAIPSPDPAERSEATREPATHDTPRRRTRTERAVGIYEIPEQHRKPGWDYQFMTVRVFNEPVDNAVLRDFREGGWRPELARDWPTLAEPGTPPDAPIDIGGQRLFSRPMSLTMEAKREDLEWAQRQQYDRMHAAASGGAAHRDHEGLPNRKGLVRVPVEVQIEGLAG